MTRDQIIIHIQSTLREIQVSLDKLKKETFVKNTKMEENKKKLYDAAVSFLGKDASPRDIADDEYGCAESVNEVYKTAFGKYISPSNILSTRVLYETMLISPIFRSTETPQEGTIIVSPTGYSKKGAKNGHVGICGKNGIVISNDSKSGLFLEYYTIASWRLYYEKKLGFPVYFFNCI